MRVHNRGWILLLVFLGVAGCGGAAPPNRQLTSAEAAIRGAQEVGAAEIPLGNMHLKDAQRRVAKAKGLMDDGNHERATLVIMRAQADAELAIAMAREKAMDDEVNEALAHAKQLRDKLQKLGAQ